MKSKLLKIEFFCDYYNLNIENWGIIWLKDGSTTVQTQQANSSKEKNMDRKLFRQFLHSSFNMTDDILMDRIFKYFNANNDGDITRDEWIMGFNVFLKGQILFDQKMEYFVSSV